MATLAPRETLASLAHLAPLALMGLLEDPAI